MATYTIKSGDTLSSIAARYKTTVANLQKLNNISNPNVIYAGRVLKVPDAYSAPTPQQQQTQATSTSTVSQTYTVKSGDTLSAIASRYGTTVAALAAKNGISNPNLIKVGQRLIISGGSSSNAPAPVPSAPPPSTGATYRVKSGDTLSAIASRYGTTVAKLAQLNGISNPNLIQVGQVLKLPSGSSAPAPTPVAPVNPSTPPSTSGGVSLAQLRAIMPNLSEAKAKEYLPYLNQAMVQGGITTPKRQAAFLAQLAHESGQLRYFEEIASGAAYEGRKDLGNIYPGDGVRYKGRGPIQLTGRHNYRVAGNALGVDFENNPTLAATKEWGFKVAVWYWNSRNLSPKADQNTQASFDAITKAINGGYNGKAARDSYWVKAKQVLGA